MSDTKIILDIDSPTHQQTKRALDNYKKSKKSLLFTPEQCGGCGATLTDFTKQKYFGEFFCQECVSKWIRGEK